MNVKYRIHLYLIVLRFSVLPPKNLSLTVDSYLSLPILLATLSLNLVVIPFIFIIQKKKPVRICAIVELRSNICNFVLRVKAPLWKMTN